MKQKDNDAERVIRYQGATMKRVWGEKNQRRDMDNISSFETAGGAEIAGKSSGGKGTGRGGKTVQTRQGR